MPIYKMNGRRDGKQKYRVRINYIAALGKARQVDRVTYGSDEAKLLELKLQQDIRQEAPAKRMTLRELFREYCNIRKNEMRESTLDKFKHITENHILPDGESGELVIAGLGVGRGYVNLPEKTASASIELNGERAY